MSRGDCALTPPPHVVRLLQAELADPEKLKAREAKFGKVLLKADSKGPKDPELMKKRAEKFKPQGLVAVTSVDDEARKKVRTCAC